MNEIAILNNPDSHNNVNILLPDLRSELLQEEDEEIVKQILKCPEIIIKFNNGITVPALIDTGSVINGLSEAWFNDNKKNIEPYEILPMTNTLIISAVGNKSKLIRKQILCDIEIDGVKNECVFLIIPELIKPCILGISFLQEMGCRIDIGNRRIELKNKADEEEYAVPIMNIELLNSEEEEEILRCIDEKIENIDCKDEGILERLKEILIRNRNVFRECPGSCLLYTSRCV